MQLLAPVQKSLERFAMSISPGYDEAKDIVSETLLEAYQCFESLRDEKAFLSFVFTIARRKQIRLSRNDHRFTSLPDDDGACYLADDSVSPENATDITLLHNAINKLGDKEKEAITLFEFAGLTVREVAVIQASNVAAVKVRLFRARRHLSKLLGAGSPAKQKKTNRLKEGRVIQYE